MLHKTLSCSRLWHTCFTATIRTSASRPSECIVSLLYMMLVKRIWWSSLVRFKMPCYCREKLRTDQSTVTNLSSHHDILDEPYPELKEPILDVRSMACRPTGIIWFRNSSIFSSYIWRCLSKAPMKRRGTRWNTDARSWLHVTWKAFLLGS